MPGGTHQHIHMLESGDQHMCMPKGHINNTLLDGTCLMCT